MEVYVIKAKFMGDWFYIKGNLDFIDKFYLVEKEQDATFFFDFVRCVNYLTKILDIKNEIKDVLEYKIEQIKK